MQQALDEGVSVREILHDGLIAGMNAVGAKFKNNEFYIPEVLIAARAMKAGMELIRPRLVEEKVEPAGIAAVGTVKGDLHDIGRITALTEARLRHLVGREPNEQHKRLKALLNQGGAE